MIRLLFILLLIIDSILLEALALGGISYLGVSLTYHLPLQLTKKNNELKRLKSTIKGVVNLAEDRNRRVKVDAHNQQVDDKQVHESKTKILKEEISTVKKKLQDQTAEHREKEQVLRKVRLYNKLGP